MEVGLIYIHYVGQNWRGENLFQFLFSNDLENTDGEDWEFRWYIDPIANGMSKWIQVRAHVFSDGNVYCLDPSPLEEEEAAAQENALRFVRERYEEFGLHEEDSESWD